MVFRARKEPSCPRICVLAFGLALVTMTCGVASGALAALAPAGMLLVPAGPCGRGPLRPRTSRLAKVMAAKTLASARTFEYHCR